MRVLMATAGAVLTTAIAGMSAGPVAAAQQPANPAPVPVNPTVQPNPATPGTQVWVYDANECTAPSGTATSQALAAPIALAPLANMTGGGGTLRAGLAAGTYTITLHCGSTLTATLHVSSAGATTSTGNRTGAGSSTGTHRASPTPAGAAATGDGSAEDHLGIGDAAVGSAFLLGGLAFGTASFIRRRRANSRG